MWSKAHYCMTPFLHSTNKQWFGPGGRPQKALAPFLLSQTSVQTDFLLSLQSARTLVE